MIKKEVICLKYKREFLSEVDSKGIPYSRICSKCKRKNKVWERCN